MKTKILPAILLTVMVLWGCGGEKEQITSSYTVDDFRSAQLAILADGISTATLTVMVLDSSNAPAANVRVYFSTSSGSITRQRTTSDDGKATATLTSTASELDIKAVVTASVLDSALKKSAGSPYRLSFESAPHEEPSGLQKSDGESAAIATTNVTFAGITFSSQLEQAVYPADGITQGQVQITLRETVTGKNVSGAKLGLRARRINIAGEAFTSDRGQAQISFAAMPRAGCDTLYIDYGAFKSRVHIINFLSTKLYVTPLRSKLTADGKSRLSLIAQLITHANNPVAGASIQFTCDAGVVTGTAVTNTKGEATAELVSTMKAMENVKIIADFNGVRDTAMVDYVNSLAAWLDMRTDASVLRDGQTKLPVTAILTDDHQLPIADALVRFSTTLGTVDSIARTNSAGEAVVQYLPDAGTTDGIATIAASHDILRKTKNITLSGIAFQAEASPDSILADGRSQATISVQLKTTTTHYALIGVPVRFSASKGKIDNQMVTDQYGAANATLTAGSTSGLSTIQVAYGGLTKTLSVYFLGSVAQKMTVQALGSQKPPRDGMTVQHFQVRLLDNLNNPLAGRKVTLSSLYGKIDSMITTGSDGLAVVQYRPDANSADVTETITAHCGDLATTLSFKLYGITMMLSVSPDSLPADGKSTASVTAQLKYTTANTVIQGATVTYSSSLGSIPTASVSDALGVATTKFTAPITPGLAAITAVYGGLSKSATVKLVADTPSTILLSASPEFIWVKETGNLDLTSITATVLSTTGEIIGNETNLRFIIRNGPNGGEQLTPANSGSSRETSVLRTVQGRARATLKSGIRSGTVEIQAYLSDHPEVISRKSLIVIRSGPPYIYVNPANKNDFTTHMTLATDYLNLFGWSFVNTFNISVYVGDKYNNPVEEGTTVYLTTTSGIVTTDVKTDAVGKGTAILMTTNPKAYVNPKDGSALSPLRIPNPNNASLMLPNVLPTFEGWRVKDLPDHTGEGDGCVTLMAYSHGKDQNSQDAVVFSTHNLITSAAMYVMEVTSQKSELHLGESTGISILLYDINGKPPSAGSSLTVSATAGKISETSLMPSGDQYGYGATRFSTTLINNLDPLQDKATVSDINVRLNSPNGMMSRTISIHLYIN